MSSTEQTISASSPEELWQSALAMREAGDDAGAIALLEQVAALLPDNARPWLAIGQIYQAAGELSRAMESFRRAGEADPFDMNAHIARAAAAHASGDTEDAIAALAEAAELTPGDPEILRNQAQLLAASGRLQEALAVCREAHAVAPDDKLVNFQLGNICDELQDFDAACRHYEAAYRVDRDPAVANNLANTLSRKGRTGEAIALMQETLAAQPDFADGWNSLGGFLLSQKRFAEAEQAFDRALACAPDDFAALTGKARAMRFGGRAEECLSWYGRALAVAPDLAMLHAERAAVELELNRRDRAEAGFRKALSLDDSRGHDWLMLANILRERKRHRDALEAAERALTLDPELYSAFAIAADAARELDDPETSQRHIAAALAQARSLQDTEFLQAIAGIYERWSELAPAIDIYREILQLDPEHRIARARLFDLSLSLCDWQHYDELCRAQIDQLERDLEDSEGDLSLDVFNMQALPISYEATARAARVAAHQIARQAHEKEAGQPFAHAPRKRDRLRVGYLLAYTWLHSLPLVLKDLVERHDRTRFEVYGYSITGCPGDDFSPGYRAAFDHFRDIPSSMPFTAAKAIYDDGIDVLIDVTGLTSLNCMPISSFRPAPVQIHAYGYSITTGADYIDYLITDRTYIQPEWEALGPEKLIYLPGCFLPTKRPETSATYTPSRSDYGLPEDGVVFCNFNHPCKFEPTAFGGWMEILRQTPGSVLWLGAYFDETEASLRREADRRGVAPERLIFVPLLKHPDHLSRLRLADLALDNLHHGGGVTTMDALWAGVPVLTVLGNTPASRLGATLVRAAGVPEMVRPDLESYVARGIELAADRVALADLKRRLLEGRENSALFDNNAYARHVDSAIAAAWRNYCDGNAPCRIEVAADDSAVMGPACDVQAPQSDGRTI